LKRFHPSPPETPFYDSRKGVDRSLSGGQSPPDDTSWGGTPGRSKDTYEVPGEHVMMYIGQPTQLYIRIPEPKEIWPTLRDRDGGNPDNRNNKESIHVLLIEGTGIPDHDVEITVQMILPSGGHDHTNQPPTEMRGLLTATGGTTATGNGEVTARTNAQGGITVTHAAPEFGGRFELIARAQVQGKILEDRDTLTVRVPDLVELPEVNYYELIGRTNDHPSNHWATQLVMENIQSIAMAWFLLYPNESPISINDISLEYGGLFDVTGNWRPPHSSHRIGTDVDVRTALPGLRSGIPTRTPRDATDWAATTWVGNINFEDICRVFNGEPELHSPDSANEHYHIDF